MTALLDLPLVPDTDRVRRRPSLYDEGAARTGGSGPGPVRSAPVRPSRRPRQAIGGGCTRGSDQLGRVPARTEPVALRLTRRGRLLVMVLVVLAGLALLGIAASQASQAQRQPAQAPSTVVVQDGDTLWQIARQVAPAESPAAVVAALREVNGLDAGPLQPGQVLLVPSG